MSLWIVGTPPFSALLRGGNIGHPPFSFLARVAM
jgi:hypothetical protein